MRFRPLIPGAPKAREQVLMALREGISAASLGERPGNARQKVNESVTLSKQQLRTEARRRRAALVRAGFAQELASHASALAIDAGAIVGGYHAVGDEADPALLLRRLVELGQTIAFPRVVAKAAPLEFHRVPDGEILQPGAFGIHEPLDHWPVVTPSLLLVPLLVFDAQGHRLGYGGGYYDRTLASLQNVRTIGIAYAGQEIASLPHDAHDMALDGVLTEQGFRRFS